MFGYEIESSGLVKTHLSNKNNNMIDLKCGPPSISVVPSHMAGQMQGNLPKIGSGMDFSHIWTTYIASLSNDIITFPFLEIYFFLTKSTLKA